MSTNNRVDKLGLEDNDIFRGTKDTVSSWCLYQVYFYERISIVTARNDCFVFYKSKRKKIYKSKTYWIQEIQSIHLFSSVLCIYLFLVFCIYLFSNAVHKIYFSVMCIVLLSNALHSFIF